MNDQSPAFVGPTRAEHAAGMAAYQQEGVRLVREIGNRGPARFDADGRLDPDILAAFRKHGFYIFEGVLKREELEDLEHDVALLAAAVVLDHGELFRDLGGCLY